MKTLIAVGLNHRGTPQDLRARFAFGLDQLAGPLHGAREGLGNPDGHPEVLLLSTCNRFELYCAGADPGLTESAIAWLAALGRVSRRELERHAYVLESREVALHAFRVASGLDSMVLGETQILGQMKRAVREANAAGCLGATLSQLFQRAFSVAKKVRSATGVGAHTVSVASAAAHLVCRPEGDRTAGRVLLVGAGETMELVATHLAKRRPGAVAAVANRTFEHGRRLAERLNAEAMPLEDLGARLPEFDTVVACTASRVPIVERHMVETALAVRGGRSMLLVDLGVPRNIDPGAADLEGVCLRSVDDLAALVQAGSQSRIGAAERAAPIVDAGVRAFAEWVERRQAVPLIRALHAQTDAWRTAELVRARKRLKRGEDVDRVLEALARGLTRKMLHGAMAELRNANHAESAELAQTVTQLFLRCPVRSPLTGLAGEPGGPASSADIVAFARTRSTAAEETPVPQAAPAARAANASRG
ncbi:MAG: glutamyl-tRNA reductase [Alphaproteobacteria bacterium]|nr:glutamyl-tRNA reductase [Alphaproteobacteria bacterium]